MRISSKAALLTLLVMGACHRNDPTPTPSPTGECVNINSKVMFVMEASDRMLESAKLAPDGTPDPRGQSKWKQARNGVKQAIIHHDAANDFGLLTFPSAGSCHGSDALWLAGTGGGRIVACSRGNTGGGSSWTTPILTTNASSRTRRSGLAVTRTTISTTST